MTMALHNPALLADTRSDNLFVDVGLLLVEGRTPEPHTLRGYREGPHIPPITPQEKKVQNHCCNEGDFVCERASGLRKHLSLLSENSAPMTIDVLLSPDCSCGAVRASSVNICCLPSSEDLLIEQWTVSKISSQTPQKNLVDERLLMQAIRSQLHFSQLSSWYRLGKVKNVTYRLSHPVGCAEFTRPPVHHDFRIALLKCGSYIKVSHKSLPRLENMPTVTCPIHHTTASPLSTTMTVVKSVFAELGQCLLDPPAKIPVVKQGFTMWRDNKTTLSPSKSRHKTLRSPTKYRHHFVPGLVDDRMQSGCKHIGKHHCEDDNEERCSPPNPARFNRGGGEKSCSIGKHHNGCDYDLNKPHTPGAFDILRTQVCNRVSLPELPLSKAENILSAILKTGTSSTSNPLKRKKSGLETSSKRLLSGEKLCPGDCSELAASFTRLEITTKDPPQVSKTLPTSDRRPTFIKPAQKHIPSPIPLRKSTWRTDSSSEETECDSPISNGPSPRCLPTSTPKLSSARRLHQSSLLGNFEENILKGRLKPVSVVEGFSADLGASGTFYPQHLKLPVIVSFFSFEPHSAPYLGHIKLSKKGYTVPRKGTIQVTLFNPLGTVIKMFVVHYDMKDMPDNSLTMVRQRAWGPSNRLRYLINLRFCSSKSGRISLHSDIKLLISRQYDVDSSIGLDMESPAHLRSATEQTSEPKYSLKPILNRRGL